MTTTSEQTEWEQLLAEGVETVTPESYMQPGEIINRPSADAPAPMQVSDLAYKGYVEVWDTQTGRLASQPQWLLWQTMSKTREDGSKVFTLTNPQIPQTHGADLFCPLNPQSPEYSKLHQMGFKSCPKEHIPHQDGLNRHVRKSHPRAWEALELDRLERIRDEDRQLTRDAMKLNSEVLMAMTNAAARGVAGPRTPGPVETQPFSSVCIKCARSFKGNTHTLANKKLGLHQRHCKA